MAAAALSDNTSDCRTGYDIFDLHHIHVMAYIKCPQCGNDKVEYRSTGSVCDECGCGAEDE